MDKDIHSYSWLSTQSMLTDVLTKEMKIPQALEDVILKNEIAISQPLVNEVKAVGTEIRMVNIRNRWSLKISMTSQMLNLYAFKNF